MASRGGAGARRRGSTELGEGIVNHQRPMASGKAARQPRARGALPTPTFEALKAAQQQMASTYSTMVQQAGGDRVKVWVPQAAKATLEAAAAALAPVLGRQPNGVAAMLVVFATGDIFGAVLNGWEAHSRCGRSRGNRGGRARGRSRTEGERDEGSGNSQAAAAAPAAAAAEPEAAATAAAAAAAAAAGEGSPPAPGTANTEREPPFTRAAARHMAESQEAAEPAQPRDPRRGGDRHTPSVELCCKEVDHSTSPTYCLQDGQLSQETSDRSLSRRWKDLSDVLEQLASHALRLHGVPPGDTAMATAVICEMAQVGGCKDVRARVSGQQWLTAVARPPPSSQSAYIVWGATSSASRPYLSAARHLRSGSSPPTSWARAACRQAWRPRCSGLPSQRSCTVQGTPGWQFAALIRPRSPPTSWLPT